MGKLSYAVLVGVCLLMAGCTSLKETTTTKTPDGKSVMVNEVQDGRCTVQSRATILGIYVSFFDFMTEGSSPQKVYLGYVNHETQVVPRGEAAEIKKSYTDILGDNKIDVDMTVNKDAK